jgi:diacylglycerol kinase family enzyme
MTRAGIEVIVNAGSGGVCPEVSLHVEEAFRALGADARITFAADGTDLVNLARVTARGDAERIVAGGGDGTLNAVAAATIDSGKTLGVLPLGTLNHFAKDLGIPLDLEGAVGAIVAGHAVRVDVGEVNGHLFLNNASLGLYPRIVRERERQQRAGNGAPR